MVGNASASASTNRIEKQERGFATEFGFIEKMSNRERQETYGPKQNTLVSRALSRLSNDRLLPKHSVDAAARISGAVTFLAVAIGCSIGRS